MFDNIIKNQISPNSYYVLDCIKNKVEPSKLVNKSLEIRNLKKLGCLDLDGITPLGIELSLKISGFLDVSESNSIDNRDDLDKYLNLWPRKILPSGKNARVAKMNLVPVFAWFFANHQFEWETILKATQAYLNQQIIENFKYCRNSKYFIRKQEVNSKIFNSDLADWCLRIENGLEEDDYKVITEKVV